MLIFIILYNRNKVYNVDLDTGTTADELGRSSFKVRVLVTGKGKSKGCRFG